MMSLIKISIISLLGLILLVSCEKGKRSLPIDADGNTYDTVVIGRQVWLSENLKTTKFNVGTLIPLLPENADWTANGSGACCWYENDINNKDTYRSDFGRGTEGFPKGAAHGGSIPMMAHLISLVLSVSK